ncbi:uncharacterized protein PV09_06318 [Verruconis gallopava]|uniref:Uncharacterized protein n=1 Tax=Verruconis gallopava TaxID=253628 RepID=A0A0D2A7L7_9PEZI|nr:uncharacterized protein PV09_06318 [Verruconis gallopava]KIW02520.1 hypothetical protein PV09_06318 [Verruconis gallopava]
MARGKIILLTGAPTCDEIVNDRLLDGLEPSVSRYIAGSIGENTPDPTPSRQWPNWRALSDDVDAALHKGAGNRTKPQSAALSVAVPALHRRDGDENNEFLESALDDYTQATSTEFAAGTSYESTFMQESFLSDAATDSFVSSAGDPAPPVPVAFTNLKDLPRAAFLEDSYPQTVTVNLVAGVVSVEPVRSVQLRRDSRVRMELVEVAVGDETRAGFSITFWLPTQGETAEVRTALERLRSRHVVLITNVALRVWRGQVYGQSLSRRVSKHETTITRLDSSVRLSTSDGKSDSLTAAFRDKVERVERWVNKFLLPVGHSLESRPAAAKADRGRRESILIEHGELPPDTQ